MPRLLCRWIRTGDDRLEARWAPAAAHLRPGRTDAAGPQRLAPVLSSPPA